jgi:glycosyltransferase involved in cell wall biosynthesis
MEKHPNPVLSICIPTYNRVNFLTYNLNLLADIIYSNKLFDDIIIIVADNSSTDNTVSVVKAKIEEFNKINFRLYCHDKNIGGSNNVVFTVSKAETEFCMTLGDDDYINSKYLTTILDKIKNEKELYCIIPAVQSINPDKSLMTGKGRDLNQKSRLYKKGFKSCCHNIGRATQLSGLVFRKEEVIENYIKNEMNNLYGQVFFILSNCLKGYALHLTDYPVLVTQTVQSNKAWDYGTNCLLLDQFENCIYLDLSYIKVSILEMISIFQTRYLLRTIKISGLLEIIKDKKTTIPASICLLLFMPVVLFEKYLKKIYWKLIKR